MTISETIGKYNVSGSGDGRLEITHRPSGQAVTINQGEVVAGSVNLSGSIAIGEVLTMAAEDLTQVAGKEGEFRVHDGTDGANANAEGLARHDGADWISQVNGGVIA